MPMFREIAITEDMVERAHRLATDFGQIRNSIRDGSGNLAGFLGEECFLAAYPKAVRVSGHHHDILLGGKRIEIKTKDRTVRPQPEFEVSIASYNTAQNPDYYVFVSLLRHANVFFKGFLCGFITPVEYFKSATFLREGQVDPSNNFTVRANCYNLPISGLKPFTMQQAAN